MSHDLQVEYIHLLGVLIVKYKKNPSGYSGPGKHLLWVDRWTDGQYSSCPFLMADDKDVGQINA